MLQKKGFTLIEMLIVIGIVGLVSVFAVPYSMDQITDNRAYDTAAELSSAIFNSQQSANALKDGKTYAVEIRETGYSLISSLDENLATDGLVGYWKFNENSVNGTNDEILDSSGNNNHGTAFQGTTLSTEGFGNSAKFDGTDDYIAFLDDSDVEVDSSPLSLLNSETSMAVSVWFRTNTLTGGDDSLRYIVSKEGANSSGTSFILRLNTSTDKLEFYLGGASYVSVSSGVLSPNTWYHAVATWNGMTMYIYINGVQVDFIAKSGATGTTTIPVRVGSLNVGDGNARNWSGEIDELRIYNLHLTSTNVTDLYNYNHRKYTKTDIAYSNGVKSDVISTKKVINFDEGGFRPSFSTSFNVVYGGSQVFVEVNSEGLINYYIN